MKILLLKVNKFATFCRKNCQILQIKFTNQRTFLSPEARKITLIY